MATDYTIRQVAWHDAKEALRQVREQVFVQEQNVPQALEWDGRDAQCLHLLASDAHGRPIGTVRLLPDGHIGRMAVLGPWRRRGVGSALLHQILELAHKQGLTLVHLAAQHSAIEFYRHHGFELIGETYIEAGILHRDMRKHLGPSA